MGWICPIYIFQLHMLSCMDWICPLYIPIAYVVLYVLDLSFIYIFQLHMLSCMCWICPLYIYSNWICCPVCAGFVLYIYIPIAYVVLYVLDLSFIYIYSNCICCPVKLVSCRYCLVLHMLSSNVVLLSYKSCPANVTLYMLLCCSVHVRPVNANCMCCPVYIVLNTLSCMCCPVCCPVYIFQHIMSCKYCSPAYIIRCPVCDVLLILSYACYLVNIVLYSFPSTYCSVIMHMQYA